MQAAMEHVDEQYLDEIVKCDVSNKDPGARRKSTDVVVKDDGITYDEILVRSFSVLAGQ